MIDIRRIMCPIDFSEHSRHALDHAVAVAHWYGATVTAFHVVAPPDWLMDGSMALADTVRSSAALAQVTAEVERFVDTTQRDTVKIEALVREGRPVAEIVGQASTLDADLLVLGTHGRSGFERFVLGSTTEQVIRKAVCPVLTVPRHLPDAVPMAAGLCKHILCPVDFSDSSERALKCAVQLSQEADAQLVALHVVEHEFVTMPDLATELLATPSLSVLEFIEQRVRLAQERLVSLVPRSAPAFCHVESVVVHGKAWREILAVAAERQSDLIVMGVEGRGAVDLAMLGSTTQQVLRGATCPVLTLRR